MQQLIGDLFMQARQPLAGGAEEDQARVSVSPSLARGATGSPSPPTAVMIAVFPAAISISWRSAATNDVAVSAPLRAISCRFILEEDGMATLERW